MINKLNKQLNDYLNQNDYDSFCKVIYNIIVTLFFKRELNLITDVNIKEIAYDIIGLNIFKFSKSIKDKNFDWITYINKNLLKWISFYEEDNKYIYLEEESYDMNYLNDIIDYENESKKNYNDIDTEEIIDVIMMKYCKYNNKTIQYKYLRISLEVSILNNRPMLLFLSKKKYLNQFLLLWNTYKNCKQDFRNEF